MTKSCTSEICLLPVKLLLAGVFLLGYQTDSHSSPHWTNFFSLALNHDDLDVRDSQNRPVKSDKAASTLKELFISTVFNSILSRDLPLISQSRKILEKILTPLAEQISRAKRWAASRGEKAMLVSFKRLLESPIRRWLAIIFCHLIFCTIFLTATRFPNTEHLPINLPLLC